MTSLRWFAVLQSLISAGLVAGPLGTARAARPAAVFSVVGLGVDRIRRLVCAARRADAAAVGDVEPCHRHAGVSGDNLRLSAAGAPDGRRREPVGPPPRRCGRGGRRRSRRRSAPARWSSPRRSRCQTPSTALLSVWHPRAWALAAAAVFSVVVFVRRGRETRPLACHLTAISCLVQAVVQAVYGVAMTGRLVGRRRGAVRGGVRR